MGKDRVPRDLVEAPVDEDNVPSELSEAWGTDGGGPRCLLPRPCRTLLACHVRRP
jgi:hypothetical protein